MNAAVRSAERDDDLDIGNTIGLPVTAVELAGYDAELGDESTFGGRFKLDGCLWSFSSGSAAATSESTVNSLFGLDARAGAGLFFDIFIRRTCNG